MTLMHDECKEHEEGLVLEDRGVTVVGYAGSTPGGSWTRPMRLPSLSLNQAARSASLYATPFTVLRPGKSYSSKASAASGGMGG
jgi:hypothetical protein